jgi:N utilization substance protein A
MTQEKLDEQLDKSMAAFSQIPGVTDELAEDLVVQGFFTFDDLSVIEPDQLAELGSLTPEQCEAIVEVADIEAAREEDREREQARESARLRRVQAEIDSMTPPLAQSKSTTPSAEEPIEHEAAEDTDAHTALDTDAHTLEAAEDAQEELETEAASALAESEFEQEGDDADSAEMAMGEPAPETPELSGIAGDGEPEENGVSKLQPKSPTDAIQAGVGSEEATEAEEA